MASAFPAAPKDEQDIFKFFPTDRAAQNYSVEPDTFEIALVLGGTVSAGAYTAGFLDFLIEALDCWSLEKLDQNKKTPRHKVKLRIVTSTSGGSVCSLLFARALQYKYQYGPSTALDQSADNPFYRLWVERFDIASLCGIDDLPDGGDTIPGLLSGTFLDQVQQEMANWTGKPLEELSKARAQYLPKNLHLLMTVTNLRGVHYAQSYAGATNRQSYFTQHSDYFRLVAPMPFGDHAPLPAPPDAMDIQDTGNPSAGKISWHQAARIARASGAFPFGFPAVNLERPIWHYDWRWSMAVDKNNKPRIIPMKYAASYMPSNGNGHYEFSAVDGGATNNLPVEHARTWLSGLTGRNSPDAESANRCIIAVDPFADYPETDFTPPKSMFQVAAPFVRSLVSNGRFSTADFTLFVDHSVRSRMLVTPVRERKSKEGTTIDVSGGKAIASSCFGAFGGFFHKSFRDHDFRLGRANAQRFLAKHFTLPRSNPVVQNSWADFEEPEIVVKDKVTGELKSRSADGQLPENCEEEVPIIPLRATAAYIPANGFFEKKLRWPEKIKMKQIEDAVTPRVEKLVRTFLTGLGGSALSWADAYPARPISRISRAKIMRQIQIALAEHDLCERP